MGQDKKVRDGRIAFILARDIGEAFVARDVDLAAGRARCSREALAGAWRPERSIAAATGCNASCRVRLHSNLCD